MFVHMNGTHDKWVDVKEQWGTIEVHKLSLHWSLVMVGDCMSRQCGLSNSEHSSNKPHVLTASTKSSLATIITKSSLATK